jgi:acyl dehydratase
MISYQEALALKDESRPFAYADKDVLLYAVSLGMGADPRELPFVFEGAGLRVVPTMAAVLGRANVVRDLQLDMTRMLHGEQRMTVHRPLPPEASLTSEARVAEVIDKGAGKGALLLTETVLREAATGEALVTLGATLFARGDGGFGGPAGPAPEPHALPDRAPDIRHTTQTSPEQALIYRLNGDRNPLHADPEFARRGGFPAPILHGLCSYGIACRAVLTSVCDYDPTRIAAFDVRFTSPVFPGETITNEIWVDGDVVSFRSLVEARGVVSINNGRCLLRT